MSESAVIANPAAGEVFAGQPPAIYRPFLAVAAVGLLGLVLFIGLYGSSSEFAREATATSHASAQTAPATPSPASTLHWQMVVVASGCGVAVVATALAGLTFWQRAWRRHTQAREEQWRRRIARMELCQVAEQRQLEQAFQETEAKLRAKLAEVEQEKAQLQSELDQRKRAEHSLSKQRQVLESSKTVLELNVRARTQELHTLKHRHELILNSAGEGICGLDLEGRITFVNPTVEQLTGRSMEEMLGKTEQELFYPPEAQAPTAAQTSTGEQMFCRKDGSRFPAEVLRTHIEEHGRQTGSVLIFRDVTERRRAQEILAQRAAELARSNAELEQFAFVASHDLQEPLRKIQAFGDRLKTKCEALVPADALDYLQRMQSASARMRTLIDDLLAFSRVVRSSEPFVAVDLGQITREVLGDLEMRLERTGGQVEVGELPIIEADPTQMRQLLLNLIGNALKFQPPGGKPLVQVRGRVFASGSGEEFCELSVQDNGIGFDEQYTEKIFAVFQRLHGRGEYEGTGIGLAVCRRIADRHHGTIQAHSQPGHGATFLVTLPRRQNHPKKQKAAP